MSQVKARRRFRSASRRTIDSAQAKRYARLSIKRARFLVPYTRVTNLYEFASRIIAKRIFYRDGHCTNCKSINPLRLHFLAGKYNLLDENLTTLCENCYRIANS